MDMMIDTLRGEWAGLVRLSPRILVALIVIAVSTAVGVLAGRSVAGLLRRSNAPGMYGHFFANLTRWATILVGGVVALNVLGLRELAASLVAGGGIMAVVLGFAFRGVGENFLAGFFLVLGRAFRVGDIIQSGEFQGTVRAIELRHTHIRAADGRDIFIPSYDIFSKPLVNYTRDGLRRLAFTLGLDYGDDIDQAARVLGEAVRATGLALEDPRPMVRITAFEANYTVLEVAFWVDTFLQRTEPVNVRSEIMSRCRTKVLEAGFTVSSEVSTNVRVAVGDPVGVRLTP